MSEYRMKNGSVIKTGPVPEGERHFSSQPPPEENLYVYFMGGRERLNRSRAYMDAMWKKYGRNLLGFGDYPR